MKRTLLELQSTVDAVSFVGYVRDCQGIYIPIGVIYPLLACHSEINVMASLSMHHLTFQWGIISISPPMLLISDVLSEVMSVLGIFLPPKATMRKSVSWSCQFHLLLQMCTRFNVKKVYVYPSPDYLLNVVQSLSYFYFAVTMRLILPKLLDCVVYWWRETSANWLGSAWAWGLLSPRWH